MFGVENCQILSNLRKYIEIYCISVIQILVSDTSHYENMPYKIPSNWCWTTIGELFYLQAGKFINASEITDCKDDLHSYPCYGGNGLRGYVTTYNRNGLFPIIGRQGALCGNINVAEGKFYATEHAVVVETFASVDVKVFVYFLIQLNLNQYATATAQPGLAVKTINEVPIPLPPLNEQYRISHAIEKAFNKMSIIDESKYSLCMCIQQFKAGVLDIAISGKLVPQDSSDEPAIELLKRINPDFVSCDNRHYENVRYPDSWEVVKMGEMVRIISGVAYSKSDVTVSGIKVIRGGNIQAGEIIECDDDVYIDNRYADPTNNIYKGDIVLVASTGSQQLIGKTGFATRDYVQTQIGAFLRILRPKDIRCADFLNLFFQSDYYRQYIRSLAKGTNINNVKNSYIEDFVIGLPPLQEQNRIVAITNKIFYMIDEILAGL